MVSQAVVCASLGLEAQGGAVMLFLPPPRRILAFSALSTLFFLWGKDLPSLTQRA